MRTILEGGKEGRKEGRATSLSGKVGKTREARKVPKVPPSTHSNARCKGVGYAASWLLENRECTLMIEEIEE
jgi:hypothetical protein